MQGLLEGPAKQYTCQKTGKPKDDFSFVCVRMACENASLIGVRRNCASQLDLVHSDYHMHTAYNCKDTGNTKFRHSKIIIAEATLHRPRFFWYAVAYNGAAF